MAVCLPLIMLIVFGGIETADMVFLKETLKSISYEGARAAAKYDSTNSEVLSRMDAIAEGSQVDGVTFAIELPESASDVSQTVRGQVIRIIVFAPADANTVGPLKMYSGKTMQSSTLMVRE